jgi:hypothetical protein
MSAVPLTESLEDIEERKRRMLHCLKQAGITGVYACAILVLSSVAFLSSKYYLSQLPLEVTGPQSIATNFPTK